MLHIIRIPAPVQFLACCLLSEYLPQFNLWHVAYYPNTCRSSISGMLHIIRMPAGIQFQRVSYHPLEINTPMILNGPTSRNAVDLNSVSVGARQLIHLYLTTDKKTFNSGTCRQQECHHASSAILNK
jgi:hypothetical protein